MLPESMWQLCEHIWLRFVVESELNVGLRFTGLRTMVLYLPPAASAGLSVLVAHNQDSNATFEISIYDRVWENL